MTKTSAVHAHSITVLIIGSHERFRDSMENLISLQPDMEVVGAVTTTQDALAQITELHPDIILLDIPKPNAESLEAVKALRLVSSDKPIVAMSGFPTPEQVTAMLKEGVKRHIERGDDANSIVNTIRETAMSTTASANSKEQLTITGYMKAKPGTQEALLQQIDGIVAKTRQEPGCINYDFCQHQDDPTQFMFYENFVNEAAFLEHLEQPYIKLWIQFAEEQGAIFDVQRWTMLTALENS